MRKYLFLFILFFIYLVLLFGKDNNTNLVMSDTSNIDELHNIHINFNTGINSKRLNKLFSEYKYDYLINNIAVNNNSIEVKCNNINHCINKLYKLNTDKFYQNYVVSGFKIDSIDMITNTKYISEFLEETNYSYTIND